MRACVRVCMCVCVCVTSAVNKHQLFALSVLFLYYGVNNGSRANKMIF